MTASTISFLCIFAPGRSRSRTIVVMPALYPIAAVKWTGSLGLSLGKLLTWYRLSISSISGKSEFTLPRCLLARFRGRKASDPCRGASNFLWDILYVCWVLFKIGNGVCEDWYLACIQCELSEGGLAPSFWVHTYLLCESSISMVLLLESVSKRESVDPMRQTIDDQCFLSKAETSEAFSPTRSRVHQWLSS